ncbi:aminoglycoside phosphotransferase (APT) family kinase protein [Hamadaea flava]|uniref:Phosphotransferase family protein n=1 Tax=Hamadaea flava TaxID=1742688 RepID=A0ABV8LGD9_9ACTN|nr:phosphotransferase family protein [Hamadaea flava]MCP2324261.1 aminoglycoside phosphotransferase (APT) family kinase protein [Hamadaea flava]
MTDEADLPGLPFDRLAAYLGEHLSDVDSAAPWQAQSLAGGRSNLTYRIDQGTRSWVLRRPPLGHVMPKAHDMAREYRVLCGLDRTAVPSARPYLLCEDASVIGAPFLVMEHVEGVVLSSAADCAGLSAERAAAISEVLVRTLATLHDADLTGTGLETFGQPAGYLSRQAALWTAQWERTKVRDLPGFDRLARWLADRTDAYADRPATLVHGDYRLDNLILAPDTARVRAVLDWEMATRGDPVCDLALLLVYWTEPGDTLRRRVPVALGVTDRPGFGDRAAVLGAYTALRPVDGDHLDVCLALTCLKLAVIMESIYFRHLQGQHLGSDAAGMAEASAALVELGLRVADGQGVAALGS